MPKFPILFWAQSLNQIQIISCKGQALHFQSNVFVFSANGLATLVKDLLKRGEEVSSVKEVD